MIKRFGQGLVVTVIVFIFSGKIAMGEKAYHPEIFQALEARKTVFPFGVASGDPQTDKVVLWTKLFLPTGTASAGLHWEIALDSAFSRVVNGGKVRTDSASGFTVSVEAGFLEPGNTYFYRFLYNNEFSSVGRTRTVSANPQSLRLAVVSCNHFESGFFNAFRLLANRDDLDLIIHLGDYIYEYGSREETRRNPVVRTHIPGHDLLSTQDYRTRYAQYRLDPDLQEMHRLHPVIAIWDDHEIANNSYKDGAENHRPEQGDWEKRKAVARKVYFEWLPVQNRTREEIIRQFRFGEFADLFMLDGRLEGRTRQPDGVNDPARTAPDHSMLGKPQADWLIEGLTQSAARWKLIGNQVIFSEVDFSRLSKKRQRNMDAWDGYPEERDRILDSLYAHSVNNVLIFTGDVHSAWAIDLVKNPQNPQSYNRKAGAGVLGAELVTTSVSSRNLDEVVNLRVAKLMAKIIQRKKENPHIHYLNGWDHGYMLLDLTMDFARVKWIYTHNVRQRTNRFFESPAFKTNWGKNHLHREKMPYR